MSDDENSLEVSESVKLDIAKNQKKKEKKDDEEVEAEDEAEEEGDEGEDDEDEEEEEDDSEEDDNDDAVDFGDVDKIIAKPQETEETELKTEPEVDPFLGTKVKIKSPSKIFENIINKEKKQDESMNKNQNSLKKMFINENASANANESNHHIAVEGKIEGKTVFSKVILLKLII